MVTVLSLWLPILLSAVLVFLASSVFHMLLGHHAGDYAALPDEDGVGAALRSAAVGPGDYVIPHAPTAAAMRSPEYVAKMERGPVAIVTVRPTGPTDMGAMLAAWFVFLLVVSVLSGYMASRGAGPAGDFGDVFRFATTTAFAVYGLGGWTESIWFGRKWSTTIKNTVDGLVYAAITGAVFGWLWP